MGDGGKHGIKNGWVTSTPPSAREGAYVSQEPARIQCPRVRSSCHAEPALHQLHPRGRWLELGHVPVQAGLGLNEGRVVGTFSLLDLGRLPPERPFEDLVLREGKEGAIENQCKTKHVNTRATHVSEQDRRTWLPWTRRGRFAS